MWVWQCQHAISWASSVGVNSHLAFDEKPGIKFVWPKWVSEALFRCNRERSIMHMQRKSHSKPPVPWS